MHRSVLKNRKTFIRQHRQEQWCLLLVKNFTISKVCRCSDQFWKGQNILKPHRQEQLFCHFKSLKMLRLVLKSTKQSQGTWAGAVLPLSGYGICFLKSLQMHRSVLKSAKPSPTQAGAVMPLNGYKFYNLKSLQMLWSVLKSAKHSKGTQAGVVVAAVNYRFCNFKSLQILRSVL